MTQNTENIPPMPNLPRREHSPKNISRRNMLIGAGVVGVIGLGGAASVTGAVIGSRLNKNPDTPNQPPVDPEQPTDPDQNPDRQEPNEVEGDPYAPQAWGGIEPGLKGEELVEALSAPTSLSQEEAAKKYVNDLNWFMMGNRTPEEAAKFAHLDPESYLLDEEYTRTDYETFEEKRIAFSEATLPKESSEGDSDELVAMTQQDLFFSDMTSVFREMYCASYGDKSASEPYSYQFGFKEVKFEGNVARITVDVLDNLDESGEIVQGRIPEYEDGGYVPHLGKSTTIMVTMDKNDNTKKYEFSQPIIGYMGDTE